MARYLDSEELMMRDRRKAVLAEREACAKTVEKITMQEMLLAGGEMTAQERRTIRAFQAWIANKIRSRKDQ